ncbi:hypothetical protein F4778DRAFT_569374 [Xylariomycetidae sp. FL2044]|nr:hypothetical protein F4778DRAFT_569374 [Xylariomycetidae sp. FL2044]
MAWACRDWLLNLGSGLHTLLDPRPLFTLQATLVLGNPPSSSSSDLQPNLSNVTSICAENASQESDSPPPHEYVLIIPPPTKPSNHHSTRTSLATPEAEAKRGQEKSYIEQHPHFGVDKWRGPVLLFFDTDARIRVTGCLAVPKKKNTLPSIFGS